MSANAEKCVPHLFSLVGLSAFEVSPEKSLDYIVISVHMFGVRFRKASEVNACERGGSAGVIYVVCVFCVFVRFPLETGVKGKGLICAVNSNTRFRIFSDAFFKEVCLSL